MKTLLFTIGALAATLAIETHAIESAITTTTTGQGLELQLDVPVTDMLIGSGALPVATAATLGVAPPTPVNIYYVLDISGSMTLPKLTAARAGLIALNNSIGDAANTEIAYVVFAGARVESNTQQQLLEVYTADLVPLEGIQPFASSPLADVNGNGISDFQEVVLSTEVTHGVRLFTQSPRMDLYTNYQLALEAVNELIAQQPQGEINLVTFVSDGMPTRGDYLAPDALPATVANGAIINTFAVGYSTAGGCALNQPLGIMASDTGGSCTVVSDPANLSTTLPEVLTTTINHLSLSINGTLLAEQNGNEPGSLVISSIDVAPHLVVGDNSITSLTTTADGTSVSVESVVNAYREVAVTIDIRPGSDSNTLNLSARGALPVVILGSDQFDVMSVIPETLRIEAAPLNSNKKGKMHYSITDSNGDGHPDLLGHFAIGEMSLPSDATAATLTGRAVIDGQDTPIRGSDNVRIVP